MRNLSQNGILPYVVIHKEQVLHTMYGVADDAIAWDRICTSAAIGLDSLTENGGALADLETSRGKWGLRASLIGDREIAGIKTFKLPLAMSVPKFATLFPDQNAYLVRWAKHLKIKSIAKLMSALGYCDSPEYFSMFTCLLLDTRIRRLPLATLSTKRAGAAIKGAKCKTKNKYGHEARLAVVCKMAVATMVD